MVITDSDVETPINFQTLLPRMKKSGSGLESGFE